MSLAVAEIGRYMKIEASPDVHKSLASVVLKVYYSDEELEDGNINESTLAMYWYNETAGSWIRLSTDLDWVHGDGLSICSRTMCGRNVSQLQRLHCRRKQYMPIERRPSFVWCGIPAGGSQLHTAVG